MELTITRYDFTDDAAIGQLFINDQFECYTLEDKVRQVPGQDVSLWKVPGATAIPTGRYRLMLDESRRSAQGRLWSPYGAVLPHILNVPEFEGIRIHAGNSSADVEGCIIVGTQRGDDSITNSREALTSLMAKLVDVTEPMFITVA